MDHGIEDKALLSGGWARASNRKLDCNTETACPDAKWNALQLPDLPTYPGCEHLVPSRQIVHVRFKKFTTVTYDFSVRFLRMWRRQLIRQGIGRI